jgi:hypothetical protein
LHWTAEQILKLAPDAASAKAAQGLLAPKKWTSLGVNETVIWGACQGSGSNPYQTQIDLAEPAFKCSCPSRKFPCKHGLALFLFFAEQPSLFAKTVPPDTVVSWLKARSDRAAKKETAATAKSKEPKDPESQAKTAARRLDRVKDGALELQRWLEDMVRTGLAGNLSRGSASWDSQAAHLVDAQAPGLARLLKEAAVLGSHEGWQERLLEQMSLLYLLLEGFGRSATLPEDLQDEIQSLIGWKQDQQELLQDVGIADEWNVLGQRTLLEDRLQVQRTWLKGTSTGREAMILAFAYGNQAPFSGLLPGTCFDGELVFFPGRLGLRALVKTRSEVTRQLQIMPADSIARSVARWSERKAKCPWIERFPFELGRVVPATAHGHWWIIDDAKAELPLSPFRDIWKLVALSGGHPISLFGEWDGHSLLPVSACVEERFVELSV